MQRANRGSAAILRMRYRKLRIAWSVGWGLLAVLLCVLWVRSYYWADVLAGSRSKSIFFMTGVERGTVGFVLQSNLLAPFRANEWQVRGKRPNGTDSPGGVLGFYFVTTPQNVRILHFPIWLPVVVAVTFAVVPWLPWRFSLRTLLIATTLVAVALGLIVYAVRG